MILLFIFFFFYDRNFRLLIIFFTFSSSSSSFSSACSPPFPLLLQPSAFIFSAFIISFISFLALFYRLLSAFSTSLLFNEPDFQFDSDNLSFFLLVPRSFTLTVAMRFCSFSSSELLLFSHFSYREIFHVSSSSFVYLLLLF